MEDEISCCAALLHDVVEDTDVTMEKLEQQFPEEVIAVLKLLTHAENVPYFDYVRAIKANPTAVKVKLADIAHNADQSRLAGNPMPEETKAYFREKYRRARQILTEEV